MHQPGQERQLVEPWLGHEHQLRLAVGCRPLLGRVDGVPTVLQAVDGQQHVPQHGHALVVDGRAGARCGPSGLRRAQGERAKLVAAIAEVQLEALHGQRGAEVTDAGGRRHGGDRSRAEELARRAEGSGSARPDPDGHRDLGAVDGLGQAGHALR